MNIMILKKWGCEYLKAIFTQRTDSVRSLFQLLSIQFSLIHGLRINWKSLSCPQFLFLHAVITICIMWAALATCGIWELQYRSRSRALTQWKWYQGSHIYIAIRSGIYDIYNLISTCHCSCWQQLGPMQGQFVWSLHVLNSLTCLMPNWTLLIFVVLKLEYTVPNKPGQ